MRCANVVNVAELGIRTANSPAENTAAALTVQHAIPVRASQRWQFDGGVYEFDDTFHIIRPIWLEGVGGSAFRPLTEFRFPPGRHGLYFHYGQTYSAAEDCDSQGAAAINLRIEGGARSGTPVAHGVIVRAACFLSHLYIENFRGDGVHIVGDLNAVPPSSTSLFRIESLHSANNGDALVVAKATRNGRNLTIRTVSPHHLSARSPNLPFVREGDVIWLDSEESTYPRGLCQVTQVTSPDTFECEHFDEEPVDEAANIGPFRVVVGHGLFSHGGDANTGTVFACNFTGNAGWAVIENSASGSTYYGCHANANELGPYRAVNTSAQGAVFVGCYSELGGNPSEIGSPAVVVGGDHAPGLLGNAIGIRGQYLDNASARVLIGRGAEMTEMGLLALGSSQSGPGFIPPMHFQLFHQDRYLGARNEDYSLAYSYDDAEFFAATEGLLSTYRWKRVYVLGIQNQGAAFLLTTANSVAREGRPVPLGNIVLPSGWFTREGHRFTSRDSEPGTGDVHSDETTWECGDRVFRVFRNEGEANGPEGWVCVRSGTFGHYNEGYTATVTAADPKAAELSGEGTVLKRGDWIEIGETRTRIDSISGKTLALSDSVGAGIWPIEYAKPWFVEFGRIEVEA